MGVATRTLIRLAAAAPTFLIVFGLVGVVMAQGSGDAEHLRLGHEAMAAHDPTAAITHFEKGTTAEAREWLAVALMMESRSPSDQYVERAFEAAMRARTAEPGRVPSRSELAAAVRPGELVIAFLIGDEHSYAWAFDRDAFVGYQLPAPDELATVVERARSYITTGDRAGVQRISDDLLPALLGPARERLQGLKRLIVVPDGPLRGLPIGELSAGEGQRPLRQLLAVSIVEPGALLDTIRAEQAPPPEPFWQPTPLAIGVIAAVVVLLAGAAIQRRRTINRRAPRRSPGPS